MEHPLEEWRGREKIATKVQAALLLGMKPSQYGDIIAGRTEPSAARIRQIIEATRGLVTAEQLVMWKAA